MRSITYGYLWSCLACLLLIGLIYNFNILDLVALSFRDTYFVVSTLHLILSLFIICSSITFFLLSLRTRFRNTNLLLALIIHNLLAIFGCIFLLYFLLSVVFTQSLFELFQMAHPDPLTKRFFNKIFIVSAAIIIPLMSGEVILIKRAWKLRNDSQAS